MSGPNAEDGYGMYDEIDRILGQHRREAELMAGLHHTPPKTLPPIVDDDEGVGAEDGE